MAIQSTAIVAEHADPRQAAAEAHRDALQFLEARKLVSSQIITLNEQLAVNAAKGTFMMLVTVWWEAQPDSFSEESAGGP
jgi:hypothetical protein